MKNTLTALVDLLLERAELPDSKQPEYHTFRFFGRRYYRFFQSDAIYYGN